MANQAIRGATKVLAFVTMLIGSTLINVSAQQGRPIERWTAPSGEAGKRNPVSTTASSLASGQKIYVKRCVACHGKTGDGDGPDAAELGINPAKLSDRAIRLETDGELFWKISTGKKPMPDYGRRLSAADRWNLVNYLRSLAKK